MSKNSTQPPSNVAIGPEVRPVARSPINSNSRSRFELYRQKLKNRELSHGGALPSGKPRDAKNRVRSARQLVLQFVRLLGPFRRQVFWVLASVTVATLIGLLPPAGTKFVIDYGLSGKPLPEQWLRRFPTLSDPRRLLLITVIAVALTSFAKIMVHIWGRWRATRGFRFLSRLHFGRSRKKSTCP